jgi:WD40 repeat protein
MNWPKTTRGSAFSPDGRKIALYYEDGTIEILDVSKQELLKILKGHAKAVNDVVWWPDGKTLATGGYDNTVRIWRVETGEQVAAFNTHENIVSDLSLSDDGMTLASASLDRTVRLYRMASEEEVHEGASHWIPPLPVIRDETDMQEGLILKFSFEDEDFVERLGDTYLLDRSGLGNNALCGDNYRIGEGVVGKALYNNGEALALATYVLNGIGSYTIVAWIFLNDHGDSTFDGPPTLCKEIGGYQLDLVDGWIRALAYRKERKATRGAWIRDLSSEPMVATGQWVFVAAALDATTEASPLRVAVNHRSEILNSWPVQHRTVHGTATIAEGFHGRIDELMIFDRFLEEGELAELSGLGLEQHALPEVIKQESRPTYRSIGGPAPENGWDATASGAIRVRADDEKRQGGWNGAASNTVTGAGIDTFSGTGHSNDPYIKGFWWAENNPGANPRGGTVPGAHWIEYEFDHVYDLSKIWVWNFNERDHLGKNQRLFGIKDATIQVSRTGGSNPSDWTTVFAGEIAPSRGEPAMPPSLRLDLSDTQARYVVITAHNNHGDPGNIGEQKGIDGRTVVGLSEVRFFTTESLTADGE